MIDKKLTPGWKLSLIDCDQILSARNDKQPKKSLKNPLECRFDVWQVPEYTTEISAIKNQQISHKFLANIILVETNWYQRFTVSFRALGTKFDRLLNKPLRLVSPWISGQNNICRNKLILKICSKFPGIWNYIWGISRISLKSVSFLKGYWLKQDFRNFLFQFFLVTFAEEILKWKLHFLCSVSCNGKLVFLTNFML